MIYAVLLAFVTIGVWERFEAAEARSYDEAAALTAIYRDAGSFERGGEVARRGSGIRRKPARRTSGRGCSGARNLRSVDSQMERIDAHGARAAGHIRSRDRTCTTRCWPNSTWRSAIATLAFRGRHRHQRRDVGRAR